MRAAVTGATGFLGSHLCRWLVEEGHAVVALRRRLSDSGELERLGIETVLGEITDPQAVDRLVRGCHAVFHAAALIRYARSLAADHERVNVDGTRIVAAACRRVSSVRLVHVSSVAAIGVPAGERAFDEETAFNAHELPYHRSKHRAETAVLQEVAAGLDAVIVNPGSILGPWRGGYRGSELSARVARRLVVPYFVGGISTVHVADVVEGMMAALDAGRRGERYILAGENLSWRAMARIAAEEQGIRRVFVPLLRPLPEALACARAVLATRGRPGDFGLDSARLSRVHLYYDSTKARDELGYRPRPYREIVRDYLSGSWAAGPPAATPGRPGPVIGSVRS